MWNELNLPSSTTSSTSQISFEGFAIAAAFLGTAEPIEPGVIEDPAAGAPSSNCRRARRVSGVGPCVFVMWLRWCLRNAYCVRPASLTVRHHKLEEQSDFAIPNAITTNGTASNSHCHHASRVHRDGCLGLGKGHPRAGRRWVRSRGATSRLHISRGTGQ